MKTKTCFILGLLILISGSCKKRDDSNSSASLRVTLGAVFDLTGSYSEEGRCSLAALDLAVADLNARYALSGSTTRFAYKYMDAETDTNTALAAVNSLYSQGVRLLAGGPNTSAELRTIRNFLDKNMVLGLNCFSTAPSLAIAGDNIFRLVPDDYLQAKALVRMMVTDGITALVTLWRNEAYGSGLAEEMKKRFEGMGNKVFPGIAYDPSNTDYDSLIASASDQVQTAVSQYGADHVAVMLISFQDVSDFLHAASVKPVMGVVHWYGCDANTQKTSVITDTTARNFAMKVRFLAPVMALGTASDVPATVTALASRIHAATGLEPDAMALSVYDAVMIYAQCVNFAGSGDAAKIKEILPQVCSAYDYLGVRRNLNYFGDLEGANYIFWTVREIIGGASWDSYATWIFQGDFIQTKY